MKLSSRQFAASHKRGPIGFILVGGERMRYAFDCQGQALNKFQMIRVDYLDRSKHWTDYQDLITRPTKDWLQFSDSAFVKILLRIRRKSILHGPYLQKPFAIMVSRRDSYVTEREAEEAVTLALGDASTVNFQHFWDDSIIETGVQAEEISMRRRYICCRSRKRWDTNPERRERMLRRSPRDSASTLARLVTK